MRQDTSRNLKDRLARIGTATRRRISRLTGSLSPRSESGSVFPIVGLCGLVLIGACGLAIDGGRLIIMQSSLQNSIDAAGLSAFAKMNTTEIYDEVWNFTETNFANGYVGAEIIDLDTFLNEEDGTLTITATAQTPTAFMQLFGFPTLDARATSEITRAMSGLELVMVLDNTGSMRGSKLASLETAAESLLDIIFGDNETVDKLHVGIVPFSQAVNIGSSRSHWLNQSEFENLYGSRTWKGCVEARLDGDDVTDTLPGSSPFTPYYWDQYGYNPNRYCPAEVTPLTSSKQTLVDAISDMHADGSTHINLGAVWGWRMLSPKWRGQWGDEMNNLDLPLDYDEEGMNKAAVIMTDGDNQVISSWYGAYGRLGEGRLGTTNSSNAEDELDKRLEQVCTSMKDAGIAVYTVVFGHLDHSTEELMRDCASNPNFYFHATSGASLDTAFRQIGGSLSNLRVSR